MLYIQERTRISKAYVIPTHSSHNTDDSKRFINNFSSAKGITIKKYMSELSNKKMKILKKY